MRSCARGKLPKNNEIADLFGQGIVSSVDNFGSNGELPANPPLLDYLATDFIDLGWSQRVGRTTSN